jgi:hypothetical protein
MRDASSQVARCARIPGYPANFLTRTAKPAFLEDGLLDQPVLMIGLKACPSAA